MCGIAGIYHISNPGDISLEVLRSMIKVINHRGPDESGFYLDDHIGLGHARLSIIDLAGGTQPIHNEDETLWIVYNGEVFNYPELKQELVEIGHRFYTTSDTEVILHLYEQEGQGCLEKLNGQFALAIWDSKKKELFLARDRIGIRPLYYTIVKDTLIFASEIKSIFINPDVTREIDPVAIGQIFTFWTTLTPRTAFKNIFELPPGHFLRASNGKVSIKKYWEIPFSRHSEQFDLSAEKISDQIGELLRDAVRIRLRADVSVGCYLSGGLDSSVTTSLVVNNYNSDVRSFGVRFEQDDFDEGKHQKQMASFLNVNHTDIQVTNEEIGTSLPGCLWHCEIPLLRTAPVPLCLLSKVVRQSGYKVVLTGEGADEVFGGYNIFREAKARNFWSRFPDSQRRAELIGRLYPYIFDDPRLKTTLQAFFAKGLDKTDDPLFSHLIRWANTSRIKKFFSKDFAREAGGYDGYEQLRHSFPPDYQKWDYLAKAQYLEMSVFLSNYLLSSQGDRVAMANSVEIRLPFLDYRVMDLMGRVPARWKILGLNEKHILKKAFRDMLPEEIVKRPKNPYRAPIKQSLINSKTSEYVREALSDESLKTTGFFDVSKVAKLLRKVQATDSLSEIDSMALVGILSSQLIHRQFIEEFLGKSEFSVSPNLIVDRRSEALKTVQ